MSDPEAAYEFIRKLTIDSLSENVELMIHQRCLGEEGTIVWDASIMMAKFFDHQNNLSKGFLTNQVGLELGSGTGLCSLVAASLGYLIFLMFKSFVF